MEPVHLRTWIESPLGSGREPIGSTQPFASHSLKCFAILLFDLEDISRVLIFRRGKYFACLNFNIRGTDEIFLTTKISQSTV